MDDIRDSYSKLKKKFKHKLTGSGKPKPDRTGSDSHGERVGSSGSLLRPGPRVVAGGGHNRGGNGSNADDESVEPSPAVEENKSDWKSTVSVTAKLLLRGVRDSADAFPPLKSVAGGLYFILENCEVWPSSASAVHNAYRCPSGQRQINKR